MFPFEILVPYLDVLVIIDTMSARTAQLVMLKMKEKKPTTQKLMCFSAVFEKGADNEAFPWPGEGLFFKDLIQRKNISAWKYSSLLGLLHKQGCFLQWFWEQTFPSKRWWQTSSILWHLPHELSLLNWIPFCFLQTALIFEQMGKIVYSLTVSRLS